MRIQEQTYKKRGVKEQSVIVNEGVEISYWEVDIVVGKHGGREAVIFIVVEK